MDSGQGSDMIFFIRVVYRTELTIQYPEDKAQEVKSSNSHMYFMFKDIDQSWFIISQSPTCCEISSSSYHNDTKTHKDRDHHTYIRWKGKPLVR